MSDALTLYREAQQATEALAKEKLFDLRVRYAKVDAVRHCMREEIARCRIAEANRRRATVPCDDLVQALHYLENHLRQLDRAEAKALANV